MNAYACRVLELRHLRVLHEIARTGSYAAAARALGYTQPAASQQMRALERAAGTKLVIRAGRSVRLTEAGEVLVRHATGILAGVNAAEEEVGAIVGLRSGRVRLSAFPSGSAVLVPATIVRGIAVHPGLHVSLSEAEPPESLAHLRAAECDIALTFTYDGDDENDAASDLDRMPLLNEPLFAVLPAQHRLSARPWMRLEELAAEDWIAGCPRCRRNLVHVCQSVGFEPKITFATDDNAAAQSLVAAGLGVALMPRLVLRTVRRDGVVIKPVAPSIARRIIAVTLPDLRRVPAVAAVLDALVTTALDVQGAVDELPGGYDAA